MIWLMREYDTGPSLYLRDKMAPLHAGRASRGEPGYMGDVNGPGCDPDVP